MLSQGAGCLCHAGHVSSPDGSCSPYAVLGDAVLTAATVLEEQGSGEGDAASMGITVPMTGQREFLVQGRIADDGQALELRLRIMQPNGAPHPRTQAPAGCGVLVSVTAWCD